VDWYWWAAAAAAATACIGGCFSAKKNMVFDARHLIYMHPAMREKDFGLWFSAFTRSISSSSKDVETSLPYLRAVVLDT
jgi:hypothetical protein